MKKKVSKKNFTDRKAFLEDTIKYYSKDPKNRRCVNHIGSCKYSPISANQPLSQGCAIGRFLTEEAATKADGFFSSSITTIMVRHKELIPKWMLKLGKDFLQSIQNLHDDRSFWNKKGLSQQGKSQVAYIKKQYNIA